MDLNSSFLNLNPVSWSQVLKSGGGVRFSVTTRIEMRTEFRISGVSRVAGLRTDIGFTRGSHDWKVPDLPSEAAGYLSYHGCNGDFDDEFMSGGSALNETTYDEAWDRIRSSNYDTCLIQLQVGPVELDYEYSLWDRSVSKFLHIYDLEFIFGRADKGST